MSIRWKASLALLVAIFVGSTLFAVWPSTASLPDLVGAVVVAAAIADGVGLGITLGLAGGLIQDLLLGRFFGLHAVIYALLAWLTGLLKKNLYAETWLLALAVAATAILVECVVLYLFMRLVGMNITTFAGGTLGRTAETLPFFVLARMAMRRPAKEPLTRARY